MTPAAGFVPVLRERGEKGDSNAKCVCVCSTAMFWVLLRLAWRSSTKHHIGPDAIPPCSNNSAVGPNQGPSYSNQMARSTESSREDTADRPLIGAGPRVAATLQTCGERRTISPLHFDMLLLSALNGAGSCLSVVFLICAPQVQLIVVPSFGRAYISSDVTEC